MGPACSLVALARRRQASCLAGSRKGRQTSFHGPRYLQNIDANWRERVPKQESEAILAAIPSLHFSLVRLELHSTLTSATNNLRTHLWQTKTSTTELYFLN